MRHIDVHCDPSGGVNTGVLGRQRHADPGGSLVNKPSMVGESQVPARDPAFKKEREDSPGEHHSRLSPEEHHSRLISGLYPSTNVYALSQQR